MRKGDKVYVRKVFFISKLALILLLSIVIVTTVTTLQDPGEIFVPTSAASSENVSAVEATRPAEASFKDYSAVIEQNIFGPLRPNKTSWGDSANRMRSAKEELGLALFGTVSGSPTVSRAIIKDLKTNKLGLYRPGDIVAAARIESIEKDGVVLLHQGQRRILNFSTGRSKQHKANNAQPASTKNIRETAKTVKTNPPVKSYTTTEVQLTAVGIKSRDIEGILKKAVIKPYIVDGEVEGFRITGLEDKSIARKLGLKNGDIIRKINGQRLTSKQKAFQVLKKARKQANINIELLRDNETKVLSETPNAINSALETSQ